MGGVVEVGSRRSDTIDQPALDQRDQTRLVKPGRCHCAAERQESGIVTFNGTTHELVRRTLLPAHERRKVPKHEFSGLFTARDSWNLDTARLVELVPHR